MPIRYSLVAGSIVIGAGCSSPQAAEPQECGSDRTPVSASQSAPVDPDEVWGAWTGEIRYPTIWVIAGTQDSEPRIVDTLVDWLPTGEAFVTEQSLSCDSGTFLLLPYDVVLSTADGGVSDRRTGLIQVGEDGDTIVDLENPTGAGTANVDASWLAPVELPEPESEIVGYRMAISGSPDSPSFEVSVESESADSRSLRVLWKASTADR